MAVGYLTECSNQRLFVEAVGLCIEVGIGFDLESGGLKDLGVVGPGRLAELDGFVAEVQGEEVAGDAQGAGAARALHGDGAL